MSRPRRRNGSLQLAIAGITIAAAAGYYVYSKYVADSGQGSASAARSAKSISKDTKISVVVTENSVASGVPFGKLLETFPNLVLIVSPEVNDRTNPDTYRQLQAQVKAEHEYRLIPCETQSGVGHVLKHLRSTVVILPQSLASTADDIRNFVGRVIVLPRDIGGINATIHDLFFA